MDKLAKVRYKFANILVRFYQRLRAFGYRFLATCPIKGRPTINQAALFVGKGSIVFGDGVSLGYFPSPYFLSSSIYLEARNAGSMIEVGDGTVINNGCVLISEHSAITIGKNCLIGTKVEIIDSDFHALELKDRKNSKAGISRPVTILDDVFVGANARILKGVTIGRGAVIANSAVVNKDVQEFTVVAGNPATAVKILTGLVDE